MLFLSQYSDFHYATYSRFDEIIMLHTYWPATNAARALSVLSMSMFCAPPSANEP